MRVLHRQGDQNSHYLKSTRVFFNNMCNNQEVGIFLTNTIFFLQQTYKRVRGSKREGEIEFSLKICNHVSFQNKREGERERVTCANTCYNWHQCNYITCDFSREVYLIKRG